MKPFFEKWLTHLLSVLADYNQALAAEPGFHGDPLLRGEAGMISVRRFADHPSEMAMHQIKKTLGVGVLLHANSCGAPGHGSPSFGGAVPAGTKVALAADKTLITHINEGFDFLGQNLHKYNDKPLVRPSKKNTQGFLGKVRGSIKANRPISQP